jgi:hypothetical protein
VGDVIDEGVDGLEPHGQRAALVAGLEPSGDLFGGPSFRKTIADESLQRRIFLECGFTPPAQLIGSGGMKRRITPLGRALRLSSRDTVNFARWGAAAMAQIERPAALITGIWSLSSSNRCE